MKKLITLLIALAMILGLTGCGDSSKHEGEAKTPSGSSSQKGRDYQDVINDFKEKGFTNIKTETLEDLITGWVTKDGEVESVSVGGDKDYSPDVWCHNDVEVVITYHTFPKEDIDNKSQETDKTSLDIKPPYDNDSVEGLNYVDVVNAFKNAGFTNVSIEKRFEAEFWGYESDKVADIYINGSGTFKTNDTYSSDSEVRIDYYVISEPNQKSDIELTNFYARKAFEEYGAYQFPYGFKCHWIVDLIDEEQSSDGSWYFKVGVTIKNQYGTEAEAIATGTVSGTDNDCSVASFDIS